MRITVLQNLDIHHGQVSIPTPISASRHYNVTWINPHDIPIFGWWSKSIHFVPLIPHPPRHPMAPRSAPRSAPSSAPRSAKGKTWAATNGPRCLGAIACATSPRSWAFARACRTWKAVAGCLGAKGCHGMPGLEDQWDFLWKQETNETTWNNQRYPKVSKGIQRSL